MRGDRGALRWQFRLRYSILFLTACGLKIPTSEMQNLKAVHQKSRIAELESASEAATFA